MRGVGKFRLSLLHATVFISKLRAMPDSEPSSSCSHTSDRTTPDDGDGCTGAHSRDPRTRTAFLIDLFSFDVARPALRALIALKTPEHNQRRELAGLYRPAPSFVF
jgi:hypothetical protein